MISTPSRLHMNKPAKSQACVVQRSPVTNNMLKNLLRATAASSSSQQISLLVATSAPPRASFFGLPSELRNAVYELLAESTSLTLITHKRFPKRPNLCEVLLVSRQMHNEYLPVLLAHANITIKIPTGYDFRNLMSWLSGRDLRVRKALAANPRINVIFKVTSVAQYGDIDHLTTWVLFRAKEAGDPRINFNYNANIKPSAMATPMVNLLNVKVALLSALIRQIPMLGGIDVALREKEAMALGLTRCKDALLGKERTDAERLRELVGLPSAKELRERRRRDLTIGLSRTGGI